MKNSVQFTNWIVNDGKSRLFFILYITIQIVYFAYSYYYIWNTPVLKTFRQLLGHGLAISRSSANVINLNCAIILFTVCRNTISVLRTTLLNRFIPFDKNITFHIWTAWSLVFWSVIHSVGHYFNILKASGALKVSVEELSLLSGPGWTGHLVVVALFLMVTSALEAVRRKYFEMFWFTHHLFIVFFGGLLMHGSFCFIKGDIGDPCRGGPQFWKFWIASGSFYLGERIYREYRGRLPTKISKVVQHPSKVVELQFKKDSLKAQPGQYIFICCPEIGVFEWHPFTLTSSPYEDFVSVHIRVVGDWTTKFSQRLGCKFDDGQSFRPPRTLPYIMVDGGYGSASEDVFDYQVALLVGAGIGVTPFASILKTIWYRYRNNHDLKALKKVYFLWSCRDTDAFEWFQDLLLTLEEENLENFLEIHSYLTAKLKKDEVKNIFLNDETTKGGKCAITGLRAGTHFGRPNWDQIFGMLRDSHPGVDVGVFFCGPKALSEVLHKNCNKYTDVTGTGTRFYYGKENF